MKKIILGAQVNLDLIDNELTDWLNEADRPLEIDDFAREHILDDPSGAIAIAKSKLCPINGPIGIHGPVPAPTFLVADPDIEAMIQKRMQQALRACDAIGATHMVVHSPFIFLGEPYQSYDHRPILCTAIDKAAGFLSALSSAAADAGVTIVVENVHDKRPEPLIALVDAIDQPNVKLSIDTGHASVTARDGGLEPDIWISRYGMRLAHLHIADCDGQADRHWVPGQGALPWVRIGQEIASIEPVPRSIMEFRLNDRRVDVYRSVTENSDWAA